MARTTAENGSNNPDNQNGLVFQADSADRIDLPSGEFIADAKMTRDGDNLILETPYGQTATIEGYFSADPAPVLHAPDGSVLTPNLVEAFARSPMEYAAKETASDESPIGAVEEVKGEATVTRADGTVEKVTIGTPIYQGDVVETDASGAVNIVFMDETSMAVSENARLAIDEYTYDPATESGTTNFSVLRGLFVFTSGLIGRDDPDDVKIDTPVGSIGIRGTIIAGEINPGGESNISVLEGAIVIKNGGGEVTLSQQFETVRLTGFSDTMQSVGVLPAAEVGARFNSIGSVNPSLFTVINDTAQEQSSAQPSGQQTQTEQAPAAQESQPVQQSTEPAPTSSTQPAPAPAPAPVVMAPDIISLNNNTSGLPSAQTVLGQNSYTTATAAGTSSTTISTAAPSTPVSTAPVGTTQPGVTADALAPPPPPSVLQPAPVVPAAPQLAFAAIGVKDIDVSGTVVGRVSLSTGGAGTSYKFANGTLLSDNGYFQIVQDATGADVRLTTSGAAALSASLTPVALGGFNILATLNDGTVLTQSYTITTTDSNAGKIIDLDNINAASKAAIITDNHTPGNKIGFGIVAMGDVNNDGFDDFGFTNNSPDPTQGLLYKIQGQAGQIGSAAFTSVGTAQPLNAYAEYTNTVGTIVNGTTFNFVIGASIASVSVAGTTLTAGVDYNYSPTSGVITFLNARTPGTISVKYGDSGQTVIDAIGDFNGDGIGDFLIGQPQGYSSGTVISSYGNAFIMSGANPNDVKNLGTLTAGTGIGSDVAGIGDINNDGYADILVGSDSSKAFLIKGSNAPWNTNVTRTELTGGTGFGDSVAGLGDINGDGYADYAIGQTGGNGLLKIYAGSQTGGATELTTVNGAAGEGLGENIVSLGDVNGDGYSDFMATGANSAHIYFGADGISTITSGTQIGNIPANYTLTAGGSVGDFNGDGFDDFVLSFKDGVDAKSYIVLGRDDLNGKTIDANFLKNPDNAVEIKYTLDNPGDDLEIGKIGDINGDGYDDFAIGNSNANSATGEVAIVYGRNTGDTTGAGTATANGQSLVSGAGSDGFNDGGFNNVSMRGGAGNDVFNVSNTNFLGVNGGTGMDTLRASGNLDFSNVHFEKLSGIEMIQYSGTGQTMTLTLENLFNLMKTSDTGILKIDSGIGNTLNITGASMTTAGAGSTAIADALNDMGNGAAHTGTDANYNEFSIGGYKLYIDTDIAVNVSA